MELVQGLRDMKNLSIKLLCGCVLAAMLSGCGDDDNSTISVDSPDESVEPTEPQSEAAVEGGGIAVYADVDVDDFSTTNLSDSTEVLLLDDDTEGASYSALGTQLPEPLMRAALSTTEATAEKSVSTKLRSQADSYIQLIQDALTGEEGAVVNVLTNQTTMNAQSAVIRVELSADFGAHLKSANSVRNMVLKAVNEGALPEGIVVNTQGATGDKVYVGLTFWQDGDDILFWSGANLDTEEAAVSAKYTDLKTAAGLTSSGTLTISSDTEEFTQSEESAGGVDILWSIDASGSMYEEQENLANGAEQFFNSLNTAGIDYRLAVNTQGYNHTSWDGTEYACTSLHETSDGESFIDSQTSDALDKWRDLSQPGTNDSATETGFYCAREVDLTGFDRPNAQNLVVFVSDEPENETFDAYKPSAADSNYQARDFNDYQSYFEGSGDTYFSIVGTASDIRPTFNDTHPGYGDSNFSCNGDGGNASGGAHFKEIAKLTGGSSASICADSEDWSVMFDRIIETATGLASVFTLSHSPLASSVEVSVNGQEVDRDTAHLDGFDVIYGQQGASLIFYGDSLPGENDVITVDYDYLSVTATE